MKFKKNKLYSNFNYTPRYYDQEKVNWTLRKKEIQKKVEKLDYDYKDFIKVEPKVKKSTKIRNLIILGTLISIFFAIPLYYGLGIFQLFTMMFIGLGFIKLSNVLSN